MAAALTKVAALSFLPVQHLPACLPPAPATAVGRATGAALTKVGSAVSSTTKTVLANEKVGAGCCWRWAAAGGSRGLLGKAPWAPLHA